MKKLILTVAIIAGGFSAFALSNNILSVDPINIVVTAEFKEIGVDQLPKAITNAVKKDFATASISKAYVNDNEQYKLDLNVDGSTSTVYVDKDGKWLEEAAIKADTKKENTTNLE